MIHQNEIASQGIERRRTKIKSNTIKKKVIERMNTSIALGRSEIHFELKSPALPPAQGKQKRRYL